MNQRTTGQARANLATIARHAIADARRALGNDLGGGSLTDLLLDNLPQLVDVADARDLLVTIGESVPSTSAFAVAFDATREAERAFAARDTEDERSWGEPPLEGEAP